VDLITFLARVGIASRYVSETHSWSPISFTGTWPVRSNLRISASIIENVPTPTPMMISVPATAPKDAHGHMTPIPAVQLTQKVPPKQPAVAPKTVPAVPAQAPAVAGKRSLSEDITGPDVHPAKKQVVKKPKKKVRLYIFNATENQPEEDVYKEISNIMKNLMPEFETPGLNQFPEDKFPMETHKHENKVAFLMEDEILPPAYEKYVKIGVIKKNTKITDFPRANDCRMILRFDYAKKQFEGFTTEVMDQFKGICGMSLAESVKLA
jgi:hypothetical protein